jgi:trehalose 6-phosphate phosphatase
MAENAARRLPPLASAQPDWAYFLDMDGTLIEIAETPTAAATDAGLLDLIRRLHAACRGAVAVVSGRTVADLERRLPGLALPLAGQHGLERRDAGGQHHLHAAPQEAKGAIEARLSPVLRRHPGLLLEDKGLSLAVHYRRSPQLASYVHQLLQDLVGDVDDSLHLQKGKRVVEIKPAGHDKGTAVESFLAEPPFRGRRPVYIGDDVTDEHAFAVVNRRGGISIKVGKGRSAARYRLPDVAAVRGWLATIPGGEQT